MPLMNRFFLVNQTHRAQTVKTGSLTNDSYKPIILINQKDTVQWGSIPETNDFDESVLLLNSS